MFGKKKIVEIQKVASKEEQLGPKPADIPNDEPLIKFQILLRHSLPSIEVMAHAHDFGQPGDCDKPRNSTYTHFVVRGDTTWNEHQKYEGERPGPNPYLGRSIYTWRWIKHQPVKVVFSIRTDDVVMVVAMDNAQAASSESLALERREDPVGRQYDPAGGWSRGPYMKGAEISASFDLD